MGARGRGERDRGTRPRAAPARRRRRRAEGHAQRAARAPSSRASSCSTRSSASASSAMFCAGHSLGEYTALVATGALSLRRGRAARGRAGRGDARRRARTARARWPRCSASTTTRSRSRAAAPTATCGSRTSTLPARSSSPARPKVSPPPAAHAKELGAKKVMPLPVSGAFHTPFMAPARDRLRKAIAEAKPRDTEVPVVANVDALAHDQGDDWASLLSAQLCSPVRWRQCLLALADDGVTTLVELGPGGVLTGMAKRTIPNVTAISVEHAGRARLAPRAHRRAARPRRTQRARGRAPLRHRAPGRQPRCRRLHARSDASPPATSSRPGTLVGRVGDHEVRSPFAGSVMGLIAVDGERVTSEPAHRLAAHGMTCRVEPRAPPGCA